MLKKQNVVYCAAILRTNRNNISLMKNRFLPFFLIAFVFAGVGYFINTYSDSQVYIPVKQRVELAQKGINGAVEHMGSIRNNQNTGMVDPMDVLKAKQQLDLMSMEKSAQSIINWSEMGPDNWGGRTRAILIDKKDPTYKTIYAGAVSGGLWKSTTAGSSWVKIESIAQNINIASIAQAPNGDIYVGTGEGLYHLTGTGTGGFIGSGIYKSTDGNNFTLLESTIPSPENAATAGWAQVNELAVSPVTNKVFAATGAGLRVSSDGGATWINPIYVTGTIANNSRSTDVDVAPDGVILAVVGNECFRSDNGDDGSFVALSGSGATQLPVGGTIGRLEVAIAPSNSNYMYASAAKVNGEIHNIYRSTDKGNTWEVIGPGGSILFSPFRNQGTYNNTIVVFPDNPEEIILGGIDLWHWSINSSWEQRSFWAAPIFSPFYLHADHHKYVFHPTDPNVIYFGTDGGVHRSLDRAQTFHTLIKNYNVTQFYAINYGPKGDVIGGTQDNGTLYIDLMGNTPMTGIKVRGGDGGYCAISQLIPEYAFSSIYFGDVRRTINIYDQDQWMRFKPSQAAGFVTPIQLWESNYNTLSVDSVIFVADTNYYAGEQIAIRSRIPRQFNYHTLASNIVKGDTVKVQDRYAGILFYAGSNGNLYINKYALDFSISEATATALWHNISTGISNNAPTLEVSKDGNTVFIGGANGRVWMVSGISKINYSYTSSNTGVVNDLLTKREVLNIPGRAVTSIAIDPRNADHVIVTFGNYGNTNYVYRSTNATQENPVFTPVQGNLPAMPVYASLIEMHNPNYVLLGTEFGVFETQDIAADPVVWTEANNGMPRVPAFMIKQQTHNFSEVINYGAIYVGTHGRGIFRSDKFVSVPETNKPITQAKVQPQVKVFPNPVNGVTNFEFNIASQANVIVEIYNVRGQMVETMNLGMLQAGRNQVQFDASTLLKGNYFIRVKANQQHINGRFIVVK